MGGEQDNEYGEGENHEDAGRRSVTFDLSSPEKESSEEKAVDIELSQQNVERDLKSEVISIHSNLRSLPSNAMHNDSDEASQQSSLKELNSVDLKHMRGKKAREEATDDQSFNATEGLWDDTETLRAFPQLQVLRDDLDQITNAR